MTRTLTAALAALFALCGLGAAAIAQDTRLTSVGEDSLVAQDGDVYIASQPSVADLDAWAERGVSTVVNFRSRAENASLAFDPAAEAAARGMRYVEIPMGGDDGVNPEIRASLTSVLEETDGPVVLHCRGGPRAAHAYAAHLQSQGESIDDFGWSGGLSSETMSALGVE